MEDSGNPRDEYNLGTSKPNNEALVLKQLKSIKIALWTLVTVFVILPVIAGIGTGVVVGIMALSGGGSQRVEPKASDWGDVEDMNIKGSAEEMEWEGQAGGEEAGD